MTTDEQIVAAEERGYGKGYEKGRIDGALEATRSMKPADKAQAAYGLFGPGIFATGIDLAALDEGTAWRLGLWCGEQVKAAEERGYERGKAESRERPGSAGLRELPLAEPLSQGQLDRLLAFFDEQMDAAEDRGHSRGYADAQRDAAQTGSAW